MKNSKFLTEQIITYIGNKRSLLTDIKEVIDEIVIELGKEKRDITAIDLFSGSGVVARMLKECEFKVIANDLEGYSKLINTCFLSNKSEFNEEKYNKYLVELHKILDSGELKEGIITKNYAPKDDSNIQEGERAFYTNKNALDITGIVMQDQNFDDSNDGNDSNSSDVNTSKINEYGFYYNKPYGGREDSLDDFLVFLTFYDNGVCTYTDISGQGITMNYTIQVWSDFLNDFVQSQG
jgi:adenine-specific DNA methylase